MCRKTNDIIAIFIGDEILWFFQGYIYSETYMLLYLYKENIQKAASDKINRPFTCDLTNVSTDW